MRFQAPRGTNDVLPSQSHRWAWLESEFRELVGLYGYREIRTPTFEDTGLFVRTAGESSDVVSKEMYTFVDKGNRSVTLKPEGTAPSIRSVVEHSLCPPGTILRLAYVTPIFRYERPQKGRFRESHQVGIELLGAFSPAADAEVIEVTTDFYRRLGVKDVVVSLNSLGLSECRTNYSAALLSHAAPFLSGQSEEFRAKVAKNPLRLLDNKDPATIEALADAPKILDFLEDESRRDFDEVQRLLDLAKVPFEVRPEIVRGFDYYTKTVFEVQSSSLGAQSALCGGGRYDRMVEELGGSPTPSVGVAMGIERALMVLEETGGGPAEARLDAYIAVAGEAARDAAFGIARSLRAESISATINLDGKSLRAQLRTADKSGARHCVVLGDEELASGSAQVKDLATGDQRLVPVADLASVLRAGA